jgi:hypothetical protein
MAKDSSIMILGHVYWTREHYYITTMHSKDLAENCIEALLRLHCVTHLDLTTEHVLCDFCVIALLSPIRHALLLLQ